MPLRWRDVGPKIDLRDYTIRTAPRRLARMKEDPLRAVLTVVPDLPGALERLAARLG
jgi:DNA primase